MSVSHPGGPGDGLGGKYAVRSRLSSGPFASISITSRYRRFVYMLICEQVCVTPSLDWYALH